MTLTEFSALVDKAVSEMMLNGARGPLEVRISTSFVGISGDLKDLKSVWSNGLELPVIPDRWAPPGAAYVVSAKFEKPCHLACIPPGRDGWGFLGRHHRDCPHFDPTERPEELEAAMGARKS